ncbi:MAG: PduL/EutD family phosphate acyltransferase, partial [Candidatus Hodarchaeales archaeon]
EMSNVENWVKEQFEAGIRVMGMGHAVYKAMDPRAIILKEMAERLAREKGGIAQWMFETTNKMVEITQREFKLRKGYEIYPNVDLFGASIYSALEFPLELFVPIFTLSRAAGWAAHVLEEKFPEVPEIKPVLYRPSADYIGRYCGPLGCEYIPLEERGTELDDHNLVKEFVTREINNAIQDSLIPVALKTRHVHLSSEDFQKLFGRDSHFSKVRSSSRSGRSKCGVTVDLVGPKRSLYGVCVIEPFKNKTQIEISRSDGFVLGINPPTRHSGDMTGTPGIHIIGPKGAIQTKEGVICPARHIHMNPSDAENLGVTNDQVVAISFSGKKAGILDEIKVRIAPNHSLELHLDMDEGNALFLNNGDLGRIILDLDRFAYSPFR